MAFDGKPYSTSGIIPPHAWANQAPLSGEVGQEALQGAYYQARHGAKMLMCQPYPWNGRDGARNSERNHSSYSGNYWRVAECFIDMPPMATHLVAIVSFAFVAQDEHECRHRLVVTDGVSTDTGANSDLSPDNSDISIFSDDENDVLNTANRKMDKWSSDPSVFWPSVKMVSCEVELSNHYYTDATGTGLEAYVETRFTRSDSGSITAIYKPGFVWMGYQVRG